MICGPCAYDCCHDCNGFLRASVAVEVCDCARRDHRTPEADARRRETAALDREWAALDREGWT